MSQKFFVVGLVFMGSAALTVAQTPSSTTGSTTPQTMTLNGCVGGGGTTTSPYVLSSLISPTGQSLPGTPGASTGTLGVGRTPATSAPVPNTPPPTSPPAASGAGTRAGTPATGSTPSTGAASPGASGTAGATASTPSTRLPGAPGTLTPNAGTGTTGAAGTISPSSYRLNGSDLTAYQGQRVEITGQVAPTGTNPGTSAAGAPVSPMFQVHTIHPISGNCP
jgi:hypothetical protein